MRDDMDKVFTECGRGGGWANTRAKRSIRRQARRDPEEAPALRGMKALYVKYGYDRRDSHFNYGMLKKLLLANVGRSWNAVYSEICAHAKLGSEPQRRLREYVDQLVEQHVYMVGGRPYYLDGFSGGVPLLGSRRWQALYVHPESGLLLEAPHHHAFRRSKKVKKWAWADDERLSIYAMVRGIWFQYTFRKPTEDELAAEAFGQWSAAPNINESSTQRVWRARSCPSNILNDFEDVHRRPSSCYDRNVVTIYGRGCWVCCTDWAYLKDFLGEPLFPTGKKQLNTAEIRRARALVAKT